MERKRNLTIKHEKLTHTDGKLYYIVRCSGVVGFIGSGETFIEAIENAYTNAKRLEKILKRNRLRGETRA